MKKIKIIVVAGAIALTCISATVYSMATNLSEENQIHAVTTTTNTTNADLTEYFNKDNTFSITLNGIWTRQEGDEKNTIKLKNPEETLEIHVQQLEKNDLGIQTLEDFIKQYRNEALRSINDQYVTSNVDAPQLNLKENTENAATETVVTQNEITYKSFDVYISAGKYYYIFTITGNADAYDKEINTLKRAISSLEEKKQLLQ